MLDITCGKTSGVEMIRINKYANIIVVDVHLTDSIGTSIDR